MNESVTLISDKLDSIDGRNTLASKHSDLDCSQLSTFGFPTNPAQFIIVTLWLLTTLL